ncbi:MAG TPA: DNA gyrase C-terminal beta-propeller domain-containing protein, partial [Fimbriimonas sp.]|nr:DNA gyrase C-terminal beta-propeller domain-containing protein [Fimbriimonas sp.]
LKHTNLRTSFGVIMLSLVENAPRTAPLLLMLDQYIEHRRRVIIRRTKYELYRTLEDVHLQEGYQIARRFLDDVIALIRRSPDAGVARAELVREFDMSALQAQAILNMPLRNLTQLEQSKLEETYKEALRKAQDLLDILNSNERMVGVMKDEIITMRDKHGDERRTRIQAREAGEFTEEDLIPDEEAIVSISRDGYIKRVSIDAYRQQKRGGKGVNNTLKADDEPAHLFQVSTHHTILFFTDRGRVYKLKGYEIPETGRYAKGMPVINYINILGGERVTATVSVKDLTTDGYLTMITRGTGEKHSAEIKRTPLSAFANIRNNGLIAFDIEEGDELGWALKTRGDDDVILVTREGQSIRFSEKQATSRSRAAGGVRAISFKEGNPDGQVVTAAVVDESLSLLVVSEHGYGKRTKLDEYRVQSRGGSGILTMNCTEKTGLVVGAEVVEEDDKLLLMTQKGKGIRMRVKEIRATGRVAQGVRLVNMSGGDSVASIARIVKGTDDGDIEVEGAGEDTAPDATTEE